MVPNHGSYPKQLVQKKGNKVRFNKQNSNTKQSKSKQVTFVVTFPPLVKPLMKMLKKFLCLNPW